MSKSKQSTTPLGAGLIVISSVLYGSYGIWIKKLGDHFDEFFQASIRCFFVALFLLPIAYFTKQLSRIEFKRDLWQIIGLFLCGILISVPLFYAINIIGVGLGICVSYAGIVIGAFVFGRIFNNEKYTFDKLLSTILGIVGLWLIFTPSTKTYGFLALFAALLSGFAVGLHMVIAKKMKYSVIQTSMMSWSAAFFVNIPFIFVFNEKLTSFNFDINWFYLFVFIVVSMGSSFFVISGLKLIDAGVAGILGLLEIVFGVIFGLIVFNENIKSLAYVGMLLIICAAAIPYFQHYKAREIN